MQELDNEAQELVENVDEQVEAVAAFRSSVTRLKPFYTKDDVQRLAGSVYGNDERVIVCPSASSTCSQPSVPSL
jgi:hypothetical protein